MTRTPLSTSEMELSNLVALVLGDECAAEVSLRLGGSKIYVPRMHNPSSFICMLINEIDYPKLGEEYGGAEYYVSGHRARRAAEVRALAMVDSGKSVLWVRYHSGFDERSLYKLLGARRRANRAKREARS